MKVKKTQKTPLCKWRQYKHNKWKRRFISLMIQSFSNDIIIDCSTGCQKEKSIVGVLAWPQTLVLTQHRQADFINSLKTNFAPFARKEVKAMDVSKLAGFFFPLSFSFFCASSVLFCLLSFCLLQTLMRKPFLPAPFWAHRNGDEEAPPWACVITAMIQRGSCMHAGTAWSLDGGSAGKGIFSLWRWGGTVFIYLTAFLYHVFQVLKEFLKSGLQFVIQMQM